jgi:hypothetical protein
LTRRLLFDAYLNNLIGVSYSKVKIKDKTQQSPETTSSQRSFDISSSLGNTSLGSVGLGFRWLLGKNIKK